MEGKPTSIKNVDQVFPDKDVFFPSPRQTYVHMRTETNKESFGSVLVYHSRENNLSISFREIHTETRLPRWILLQVVGMTMACLCIFMNEWMKEWFRHHVFLVEQSLSQASDWYKEGFKVGENVQIFVLQRNMNLEIWCEFHEFPVVFIIIIIFLSSAFQKDMNNLTTKMCWVLWSAFQWLRMASKNPVSKRQTNRKNPTAGGSRGEAGGWNVPPGGCEFSRQKWHEPFFLDLESQPKPFICDDLQPGLAGVDLTVFSKISHRSGGETSKLHHENKRTWNVFFWAWTFGVTKFFQIVTTRWAPYQL